MPMPEPYLLKVVCLAMPMPEGEDVLVARCYDGRTDYASWNVKLRCSFKSKQQPGHIISCHIISCLAESYVSCIMYYMMHGNYYIVLCQLWTCLCISGWEVGSVRSKMWTRKVVLNFTTLPSPRWVEPPQQHNITIPSQHHHITTNMSLALKHGTSPPWWQLNAADT